MRYSREEDSLRNTSILLFLLENFLPLGWGGGHEIYKFMSLEEEDLLVLSMFNRFFIIISP